MIDMNDRVKCLLKQNRVEGGRMKYFQDFNGSLVGKEWNIRVYQRMSENDQTEILHNTKGVWLFCITQLLSHSVRPEGSEKTTPNMYKFLTLNVNNYKEKH